MLESDFKPGYVETRHGPMHYVETGEGEVVLLLHQHPRSWREYRFLMPLLASDYRTIAVDMVGFGSSALLGSHSIDVYAEGVIDGLDGLGVERTHLFGHHLGGLVAIEVSARIPDRITSRILSCVPYIDADERVRRRRSQRKLESVEWRADGEHVWDLWKTRAPFYRSGDVSLVDAFLSDALLHGRNYHVGRDAATEYLMEQRITVFPGRTLCIFAAKDPFSYPSSSLLLEALPDCESTIFHDSSFSLVEEDAAKIAARLDEFLRGHVAV